MKRDRPANPGTVLAFDFGTRRIGVAVGNTVTRTARALTTVSGTTQDARLEAIAALVAEWQPQFLLVGVPVHADGTPHAMTARAQGFARELTSRFGIEVALADERHTTELAQSALDQAGAGRKGRPLRDAMAAQLILQGYLDDAAASS